MQCLYCEHDLPEGANFCPSCGALVSRCPECSSAIYNEARFCGSCGANLSVHDMGPSENVRRARITQPALTAQFEANFLKEMGGEGIAIIYRPTRPTQRYVIGRGDNTVVAGPNNDIVISDAAISWNHALLICRDEKIQLQNTASTNGTFLNSVEVLRPLDVHHGDIIRLADIDFAMWLPPERR